MIYKNDEGTLVLVNLGSIVIYETDTIRLNIKKPSDSTSVTWDASVYSLNQPTQVYYLSDSTSFDQVGRYLLQAEVIRDGGRWLGGLTSFTVKDRWT